MDVVLGVLIKLINSVPASRGIEFALALLVVFSAYLLFKEFDYQKALKGRIETLEGKLDDNNSEYLNRMEKLVNKYQDSINNTQSALVKINEILIKIDTKLFG